MPPGSHGVAGKPELYIQNPMYIRHADFFSGIALSRDGKIYIADGANIRVVDDQGVISTLIGHQRHRATWRPLPCQGSLDADQVQLNWPTELAVSPLDGALHIIDDNVLLRLVDGRVSIVAGRPHNCPPSPGDDEATSASLVSPQSLAFAPNGDLFVAESDSQRINRVRRVSTNGRVDTYAGIDSRCNCLDAVCKCFDPDRHLAVSAQFSSVSSLAVTPDGVLYLADPSDYRLLAVSSSIPPEKSSGGFEVPDPDAQELYTFNKFGQHVLTKDLLTSNVLYQMSYTQATSDGKLSTVTDASGRKLTFMRDYKGRVNTLQTSNGLKYNLRISNVGDLESFEAPSVNHKVNFKYYSSSGLLKSKLDNGHLAFIYVYDDFGRLVDVVTPTGETISLTFNLTSAGASINVNQNGRTVRTLHIKDNLVTSTEVSGGTSEVSVSADKTLSARSPWGQTVTLATMPHPVIARLSDDVSMGDSFPMVGEQRAYLGPILVAKLGWDYSLATNGHNGQMIGIRKMMSVNGDTLLTVYYDKLQRREVLYAGSKRELLEVRYDSSSRPIHWDPRVAGFATVKQGYDRFGRLQQWSWGDVIEQYEYDKSGRLERVILGDKPILRYHFPDTETSWPDWIATGSGGKFLLNYDKESGGLSQIQTPRGHFHSFLLRPTIGSLRFLYTAPWSESRYEMQVDAIGNVLGKHLPGGERVVYTYNDSKLKKIICGDFESELGYDSADGTLESVTVRKGHSFEMRLRNKYHGGLLKEQKIRFAGGLPQLDNAVFRYQYDGNGRPSGMVAAIGGSDQQQRTWTSSYEANTGLVEALGSLRISRPTLNLTRVSDVNSGYAKSVELDSNGRTKRISYSLRQKAVLGLELAYDERDKLSKRILRDREGHRTEETYAYTPDGQLLGSGGANDFKYDSNGNLVSADGKMPLQYDAGDRVERAGAERVFYDANGCVKGVGEREKFWHDARGKLIEHLLIEDSGMTRTSFFHDHLGRLVAWHDTRGRVRQFFYADPTDPMRLTRQHNPKSGLTQTLLYDDQSKLVAVETAEQKILIATDQNGSPLLAFRSDGSVLKEILYSPFGGIVRDSNPGMELPLGFHGHLALMPQAGFTLDPRSGRIYHPRIRQYLNPNWERLAEGEMRSPLDLFVYRFRGNDPVTPHEKIRRMTDLHSWGKLFGLDITKVLDAAARKNVNNINRLTSIGHRLLNSGVNLVSGLDNTIAQAQRSLSELSFVRPARGESDDCVVVMNKRFASKPGEFGDGFLLTVAPDQRSIARVVEGVPGGVVQAILESVLNGSRFLDVSRHVTAEKSMHFFAKSNTAGLRLDLDAANRLSGAFDVAVRDLDGSSKDLRVENAELALHVAYGGSATRHRDAILSERAAQAAAAAWAREKALVQAGFSGQGDWTKGQRAELVMGRRVRGFSPVEIHSRNRFPQLLTDASNYFFMAESQQMLLQQQHRRKSRHGKTRGNKH